MTPAEDDRALRRLVRAVDPESTLLRWWDLRGGASAQVTALELRRADGRRQAVVVRRHGRADREQNPRIAADEHKLLCILATTGVPVPAPCFLDEVGEFLGPPCLVVEYVEGEAPLAPDDPGELARQMAGHLSRIHRVGGSDGRLAFLPEASERVARMLARPDGGSGDGAPERRRARAALRSAWPLPSRNEPVLLHGDFWPGNLLWKDGRIVAIVDWEDARRGDPLADVANTRLELNLAFGRGAAERFTERYRSLRAIDVADLPWWDLAAALRSGSRIAGWAGDDDDARAMREACASFVTDAFERLGARDRTHFRRGRALFAPAPTRRKPT